MRELGFSIPVTPGGAFYVYADCSAITDDSFAFATELLETEAIAITPGIDFGSHRAGEHVRVAYTTGLDRLEEACIPGQHGALREHRLRVAVRPRRAARLLLPVQPVLRAVQVNIHHNHIGFVVLHFFLESIRRIDGPDVEAHGVSDF